MDLAAKVYQNVKPENSDTEEEKSSKKEDNVEEASFEEK